MLRIALASPPVSGSIEKALPWVEKYIAEAAAKGADILCFPEAYVPGLRGADFSVDAHDPAGLREAGQHRMSKYLYFLNGEIYFKRPENRVEEVK